MKSTHKAISASAMLQSGNSPCAMNSASKHSHWVSCFGHDIFGVEAVCANNNKIMKL